MRSVACAAIVASGCYAPTIVPGTPCDVACPTGLTCIDHVCREPGYAVDAAPLIDGPGLEDLDGDGIPSAADNCPTIANADQHNEDGDGLGDLCDPCPHLAGSATDADGDGVGDACDPQPTVAKQRWVLFDPFSAERPVWDYSSGTTVVADQMKMVGADPGTSYSRLPNQATGELRIISAGSIVSVGAGIPHALSIGFGVSGGGASYHYMQFYDNGAGSGEIAINRADNDVYSQLTGSGYAGLLPTGAWSIQIDESASSHKIALHSRLGGVGRPPLGTAAPAHTTGTGIPVLVRNADVRLDYFGIIATTP